MVTVLGWQSGGIVSCGVRVMAVGCDGGVLVVECGAVRRHCWIHFHCCDADNRRLVSEIVLPDGSVWLV